MSSIRIFYILLAMLVLAAGTNAQPRNAVAASYITTPAGTSYQKSKLHQWLFGKNRRLEWSTPVRVPIVLLDTIYGGLYPYKRGGGNETRSLRLKSADGKEYALRSINKFRQHLVPRLFKNSWLGDLVQDAVSMNHPYAAFAIADMMDHAKINHAQPRLIYIPNQPALDTFKMFANNLYLLEERLEGDWSDASSLGKLKQFYSTAKVKEHLRDDNKYRADQHAFIKARLFDILISDIDRHADNWRWGETDTLSHIFQPVPQDRDQAFFTRNGLLSLPLVTVTRGRFLQNFDYNIKKVKTLTSLDRLLDKFFSNERSYSDWMQASLMLQQSLTDSVISNSVQQLPPEIFAISGSEIIEKLRYRRNKLEQYAAAYYRALARKVAVNGSKQKEHFEVRKMANNEVVVNVFRVDSNGEKEREPYYRRMFSGKETRRITLYSFGGEDVFDIEKDIRRPKVIVRRGINKIQFKAKQDLLDE